MLATTLVARWDAASLLSLYVRGQVRLGLIKSDGSGFRFIEKPVPNESGIWGIAWADNESFFCEDMQVLYRQSLDGKTLQKWTIGKLIPNGDMTGDSHLDVSPDGQTVLLDIAMNEEGERKNWDGPLPAIWPLDLATGKAKRLTPKSLYAWDGQWLDGSSILFVSQNANEKDGSIYRMSLSGDGKDKQRLVKSTTAPSADLSAR